MENEKCSVCSEPVFCHVGPSKEPLCQKHYEAWLREQRQAIDYINKLFKQLRKEACNN
jgi:hypothetical protein